MFEHCTKHRPAAEVIYVVGLRCPICAELTRLRERVIELENLNRALDRASRVVEAGNISITYSPSGMITPPKGGNHVD